MECGIRLPVPAARERAPGALTGRGRGSGQGPGKVDGVLVDLGRIGVSGVWNAALRVRVGAVQHSI